MKKIKIFISYWRMKWMVSIRDHVSCYFVITRGRNGEKTLIRNPFAESKALYVIRKFIGTIQRHFHWLRWMLATLKAWISWRQCIRFNSESSEKKEITYGVPQGSITTETWFWRKQLSNIVWKERIETTKKKCSWHRWHQKTLITSVKMKDI